MPSIDDSDSSPTHPANSLPQPPTISDGNIRTLPGVGERFTTEHAEVTLITVMPWVKKFYYENPELARVVEPDEIGELVFFRAVKAGTVHTNAEALLRKLTDQRLSDACRKLNQLRSRSGGSIDDENFDLARLPASWPPAAFDTDEEIKIAQTSVRFITWSLPEADPRGVAGLAMYLSRAGPDAPSMKDVCETLPSTWGIARLYRKWSLLPTFPERYRRSTLDFLEEQPTSTLTRAHFVAAADGDHERAGAIVYKALLTSRYSKSEFSRLIDQVRRDVARSRHSATLWRDTEAVYTANRDAALQHLCLLSEFF